MSVNADDATKYSRHLIVASTLTYAKAKAIITKAAANVKDDARRRATGIGHAPRYPYSIRYEVVGTRAEIGPEEGGPQWGLGVILEYGTQHTAPHPHLMPAAEAELPVMTEFLVQAAEKDLA